MLDAECVSDNSYSPKNSSLSLYLVIFILLICSRLFDMSTTYLATPNLSMESNIMVTTLGLGWSRFIVVNLLITMVIFLVFRISWARYCRRREASFQDGNRSKKRNIPLEIGITIPIYVIITGYFQGLINILIYMEWILVSFTHLLFLYPIVVGGIFGSVSLYLTKKILYSKKSGKKGPAHKVMMAKRESYPEEFVEEPKEEDELAFPPPPPPPNEEMEIQFEENHSSLISSNESSSNPWIMISEEERS